MSNVVFLQGDARHQSPEFLLEVRASPDCHEFTLGLGQLRSSMPDNVRTELVADMANSLARMNKAFAEYLQARIQTRGAL